MAAGEADIGSTGEALTIDSATGVDVTLRVAGPGSRTLAFLIDWLLRLMVAVAWYTAAASIYNGRLNLRAPVEADKHWLLWVLAPSLAIYFLYHYVVEVALRGRTPGKRLAGVRIVTREGNTPSTGALLARNVFRIIDSFPFCYSIGLVMTVLTSLHARIGDLAAGTLLIHERMRALPRAPLVGEARDERLQELASELLERWQELEPAVRQHLARGVLQASSSAAPSADAAAPGDDAPLNKALRELLRGSAA